MSKLRDSYETPAWLFDYLNGICKFDLDAAATEQNKKCASYLKDGLSEPWIGQVFCNPPYSNIMPWLMKAVIETQSDNCKRAVFVLPAELSTKWGSYCVNNAAQIIFLVGGRVQFVAPKGVKTSSNTKGTMIVLFNDRASHPSTEYWDIKKLINRGNDEK